MCACVCVCVCIIDEKCIYKVCSFIKIILLAKNCVSWSSSDSLVTQKKEKKKEKDSLMMMAFLVMQCLYFKAHLPIARPLSINKSMVFLWWSFLFYGVVQTYGAHNVCLRLLYPQGNTLLNLLH